MNPGDEFGLILSKNSKKVLDISTRSCANAWCKVYKWDVHNGDTQLWKIVGDDLISKWNNAKGEQDSQIWMPECDSFWRFSR